MTGNLVFYYGGGNCHPSIPGFRLITEDSSYRSVPVFLSMFVGLMLSVRLLRPCRPTDATIKQFDDLSMVVITGMMLGICTLDQISKIAGYSATVDRTSHVDHDRASSAACMQGFLILNILSHLLALGGLVTVGYFLTRSLRKRSRVSESYYPVSV